jgi:hypothetical protein
MQKKPRINFSLNLSWASFPDVLLFNYEGSENGQMEQIKKKTSWPNSMFGDKCCNYFPSCHVTQNGHYNLPRSSVSLIFSSHPRIAPWPEADECRKACVTFRRTAVIFRHMHCNSAYFQSQNLVVFHCFHSNAFHKNFSFLEISQEAGGWEIIVHM